MAGQTENYHIYYPTDYDEIADVPENDKQQALSIEAALALIDLRDIVGDITQLETIIKTSVVAAINELKGKTDEIGNLQSLETIIKTSIVAAINELKGKTDEIGNLQSLETTIKTSIVAAINELKGKTDNIGNLQSLETTIKTSIVAAINELKGKTDNIGDITQLQTTIKNNLVNAINELKTTAYNKTEIDTFLNGKLDTSLKGANNGLAELNSSGKVPSNQLPSYVDDVIEGYYYNSKFYQDSSHTIEITPENSKIYIDLLSNKTYRWSGTVYVEISESLALGETEFTAYRGDRGKEAYDRSKKNEEDLAEVKEEVEVIEEDLAEVKEEVEVIEEDLYGNIDVEAEESSIKLSGTKDGRDVSIKKIYGNSTQESTTGANLQKFSSRENPSYNYKCDEKGQVIINGTVTSVVTLGYNLSTNPMTLTAGTYKMKVIGNMSSNTLILNNQGSTISLDSNKEAIITLNADTSNYYIQIYLNTGTHNDNFYITLASGLTATTERYTGGQASPNPTYKQDINNVEGNVVVKAESKNKLDYTENFEQTSNGIIYKGSNGVYNINGVSTGGSDTSIYSIKNYTIKSDDYVHVCNNSINLNVAIALKCSDNTVISIASTIINRIYSLNNYIGKTITGIYFHTNSGITVNNLILSPMILNNVSTVTDFVIHKENTVTFPLSQGQKLMLGDTLEDDGIHHKREQITLNGTENWTKYSDNEYYVAQGKGILDNSKAGTSYIYGFCNKVTNDNDGRLLFNIIKKTTNTGGIDIQQLSSYWGFTGNNVTDFKTWLSNNPITVEYELETETIDPYTEEQQEAYNKLQKMKQYDDITYITIDKVNKFDLSYDGDRIDVLLSDVNDLKEDVSGKEDESNKTDILDENSTDTQYPNAKVVYDNLLKKAEKYTTYKISITERITSLTVYTVPFVYEVGNNSIVIFYNNEKLISENSETDLANYKEIGQIGSLSNKVKFGFDLEIGDILEFFVIEKEGNVYGVRRKITNNSSSTWERLFNSIGKNANATKNGDTVVNDFDSLAPWSGIKTCNYDLTTKKIKAWLGDVNFKFDGSNGDVFTYIPNTYWKIYQEDDYDYVLLADYPKSGFNEIDGFFIGRYNGSVVDNVLHSYSGLVPTTDKTISQFRTLANALGTNFSQLDWRYFVLQMLYLVEYADYNSQNKLGNGIVNRKYLQTLVAESNTNRAIVSSSSGYYVGQTIRIGTSDGGTQVANERKIIAIDNYSENGITGVALTFDGATVNIAIGNYVCTMAQEAGQCDSLGMKSGCLNNDGYHAVIYRGVENIFANVWQFVDGINIKDNVAYVCKDHSEYVSDKFVAPYKAVGYTNINATGWIKTLGFDINESLFRFPTEVGGSSSTYMDDYYYQNPGNRVALVGGSFYDESKAGLWHWSLVNASSIAYLYIGCRVLIDNQ